MKGLMKEGVERELRDLMEELFSAIMAKDLSRIEGCYLNAPELLVFLEGPRSRTVGWENIKAGWRHFLAAAMELETYQWGEDLLIRVYGESGFVAATNSYNWRIKGRELRTEMRGTWALERIGGNWRIVHEHGSFPHPDPYSVGDWSQRG